MAFRNKKARKIPQKLVDLRAMGMPSVECKVPGCGEWLWMLTHTHVAKHEMTQEEYCSRYPEQCDIFYWAEAPTSANRGKFQRYLRAIKKAPPSGESEAINKGD